MYALELKPKNSFFATFLIAAVRVGSYKRCSVDDVIPDTYHPLTLGSSFP